MDFTGRSQHLSPTVPRMVSDTAVIPALKSQLLAVTSPFALGKIIPDQELEHKWWTGNATVENSSVRGNCNSLLLPVPIVTFFSNKLLRVFQTFLFHFSVDFYSFIKNSSQVTLSMFEFKKEVSDLHVPPSSHCVIIDYLFIIFRILSVAVPFQMHGFISW